MTSSDPYRYGYDSPVLSSYSRRRASDSAAHLLPHLAPGQVLLDLGCGPGTITADLAAAVRPGRVIAVDADAVVLTRAAEHVAARGLDNVEFRLADGAALDLADDSVDVAHAHQVLQHVGDPVAVLRELGRVVRTGGIVAIRDADYGSFSWYPEPPGLRRWAEVYLALARSRGAEPMAGRRLLAWARAAGLRPLASTSSTWTYPAGEAARWWGQSWAERTRAEAYGVRALAAGLVDEQGIDEIAGAWLEWAEDPDAWFMIAHGELIAAVE